MIHPVILSGGSGTRLWPLSRAALPKQLLPLMSERSMLQETVLRLTGLPDVGSPMVVCGNDHRFLVAEQMQEIGVEHPALLLEPIGRNTAPAVAVAALALLEHDADAVMLVLPADHLIADTEAFHRAIARAAKAAEAGLLVTFGIQPDAPETGYGYIRRGEALADLEGTFRVGAFVEKPDRPTAENYLKNGDYFWNSGMFVFKAQRFLAELDKFRPDILQAANAAWLQRKADLDFCRLDAGAFEACPSESIDYAVMEKTADAAVIPVDIGWNDVGSWSSLWQTASGRDDMGNIVRGDVMLEKVGNSYVRAESRMVAVIGLDDVIVVETPDAVMVAHKDQAQQVKKIVERLHSDERGEHLSHTRVFRPWGWYEQRDAGDRFQVKRIMLKPGAKISLQSHKHRSEHWVVVNGTAKVTRGEDIITLHENQSTYIPAGMVHRLENDSDVPLHIVEIQSGGYLGEDDIVRLEDVYKRDE
jgi:mannose-1-phosphate guanylyltransferase/mannose-6-phosphate isomerase